jgi:hypothetical protein
MTSRPSVTASLLAVLGCLLFFFLLYLGSYLWLGVRVQCQTINLSGNTVDFTQVIYNHDWQLRLFRPAARVESLVTSREVTVHRREEFISP